MKNRVFVLNAAIIAMCAGSAAQANTVTNVTLYPGDLGSTNVIGNSSSAPGFANSSWQADTTASSADNKSELYIPVADLFSGTVDISDIKSISYWTNKPGDAGSVDWTLEIYTNPNANASLNEASWYQSRLNAEPYFTQTSDADDAANTWHQWTTSGPNALLFYDQGRSGNFGTYTDPTLSDITSGSVTWGNNVQHDYSSESVEYFSFQTGSAWADGFDGLLDGFTVTLNDGDVANVNFETTVPLPASAWSGLALLGGLGLSGAIKRHRKQMA